MSKEEILEVSEPISGLYYIDNINEDTKTMLDKLKWSPITSSKNSRVVQHYGFTYNYRDSNVDQKADPIPEFLIPLQILLKDICLQLEIIKEDYTFNQCIVNNYLPGQGISKHIDSRKFGGVIG